MIWGLSLTEILKRMKYDTSASPLFQFKKSFNSYWVFIQKPNAILGIKFQTWHHLHKYAFKGRFLRNDAIKGCKIWWCALSHLGANLEVCAHGWVALMCESEPPGDSVAILVALHAVWPYEGALHSYRLHRKLYLRAYIRKLDRLFSSLTCSLCSVLS